MKPILLVEDNADDEALTMRAFRSNNIRNEIIVARDGAEALEYLFGTGAHAGPRSARASAGRPARPEASEGRRAGGFEARSRRRSADRHIARRDPNLLEGAAGHHQRLQFGCNSYVRKPVDFDQFMEAARQLGLYWLLLNEPAPGVGAEKFLERRMTASPKIQPKILIVEDSDDDADLLLRELRRERDRPGISSASCRPTA